MPYDNIVIWARTKEDSNKRKYYDVFVGGKDVNGNSTTKSLYKVYRDDKRLRK